MLQAPGFCASYLLQHSNYVSHHVSSILNVLAIATGAGSTGLAGTQSVLGFLRSPATTTAQLLPGLPLIRRHYSAAASGPTTTGAAGAAGAAAAAAAAAARGAEDMLRPYIPPWVDVLLPAAAAVQRSAQVKSAKFLSSAYTSEQLRPPQWPEVAILGRSNVGKSSLVNYLLGSSNLAKVSNTPGRTSSINLYLVNNSWCLADCPGYGYAKTSKTARADWHAMTQVYLKQRSKAGRLVDVLLLIDASIPPREMDLAGAEWLLSRKFPVTLVYTKCDKFKKGEPSAADNITAFREQIDGSKLLQPAQLPTCAVGSSSFGRQELLLYLARRVAVHTGTEQPAVFAAGS